MPDTGETEANPLNTRPGPRRSVIIHCPNCGYSLNYERDQGAHILHCAICGIDYYPRHRADLLEADTVDETNTPRRRSRHGAATTLHHGSPEWLARWSARHRGVISLVDAGLSTQRIADLTGVSRKRIKELSRELHEWREAGAL